MPGTKALIISARHAMRPWLLFLAFVCMTFLVEWGVMACLPIIIDSVAYPAVASLIDASSLTILLAPLAWWLFLVPLQRLIDTRTHLLNSLLKAQEEERGRIARDLHDGVGQSFTGLMVGLRAIEESASQESVKDLARGLRQQGIHTHEELRRLVRGLRPYQLDELGLVPAIKLEVESLTEQHRIRIDFKIGPGADRRWPLPVESAVFRIFQEATNNAIKHGRPTLIDIGLHRIGKHLRVDIRDNGYGFDQETAWTGTGSERPFGLLSMRERAALLGGTLLLESTISGGTLVRATIPVNTKDSTRE